MSEQNFWRLRLGSTEHKESQHEDVYKSEKRLISISYDVSKDLSHCKTLDDFKKVHNKSPREVHKFVSKLKNGDTVLLYRPHAQNQTEKYELVKVTSDYKPLGKDPNAQNIVGAKKIAKLEIKYLPVREVELIKTIAKNNWGIAKRIFNQPVALQRINPDNTSRYNDFCKLLP